MGKITLRGPVPKCHPMLSSGPEVFSRPELSASSATSANATNETSTDSISPLEAMERRIDARLRASGRTVTVETAPSDGQELTVTFPANQPPRSKKGRLARHDLRAAYLATNFVFEAEGQRYTLRVGEQNPQVRDLLAKQGAQGAAYITAFNPASLQLGEVHNTLAMRALLRDLKASDGESWAVYEGAGQDRAGNWAPEPSLMVLGIDRAQAEKLGRRYGQYAIVWIDATGTPSLVELADLDRASRYSLKNPPFKWVELGIEWGYEWVDIRVNPSRWRRILAGELLVLTTRAWNDGEGFTLYWGFDGGNRLYVSYGDGGTAYDGRLTGVTMRLP